MKLTNERKVMRYDNLLRGYLHGELTDEETLELLDATLQEVNRLARIAREIKRSWEK